MTQPTIVNGYCAINDIKSALSLADTDTINDQAIANAIDAASRLIEDYTERFFWQDGTTIAPVTRYFTPASERIMLIDDAVSLNEVAVDLSYDQSYATIFATTDYMFEPANAARKGKPYTRLVAVGRYVFPLGFNQSVRIKGVWGWPAIPAVVRQACQIQATRLFSRSSSPFGIAGSPDIGVVRLSSKLDADVQVLLEGVGSKKGVAF